MKPGSLLTGLIAALVCLSGCVAPQQIAYSDFFKSVASAEINADSLRLGWQDGLATANQADTGGYLAGGFVAGLPVGVLVPFAALYAVRRDTVLSVPVEDHVRRQPEVYQRAFRRAYAERVRVRRVRSTFLGGLLGIGSGIGVLIYVVSRFSDT